MYTNFFHSNKIRIINKSKKQNQHTLRNHRVVHQFVSKNI